MGLFERLRQEHRTDWKRYTHHPFVEGLREGTLPEDCFRHYLIQDYLFLIHFARAYALAVYKAKNLAEMHAAKEILVNILDNEMALHVSFSKKWGVEQKEMERAKESTLNMAYTRYVLECGLSGDLLHLLCALAPCVMGYAEIGKRLSLEKNLAKNPYRAWIKEYASPAYQESARKAKRQMNLLGQDMRAKDFAIMSRIFGDATRLEVGFWQMGLDKI